MGRYFVWTLGVSFGIALGAVPAVAQTHVSVGVFTPNIGAHVVVGSPRVYYPPPVYVVEPRVVIVERDRYYRPYRGHPGRGWAHGRKHGKFARAYYDPYPSRVYRSRAYVGPNYRDDYRARDRHRRR